LPKKRAHSLHANLLHRYKIRVHASDKFWDCCYMAYKKLSWNHLIETVVALVAESIWYLYFIFSYYIMSVFIYFCSIIIWKNVGVDSKRWWREEKNQKIGFSLSYFVSCIELYMTTYMKKIDQSLIRSIK